MSLNKQQQGAVDFGQGPLALNASSGSGKTRCIIERVKKLLNDGTYSPTRLFVITFTNLAADEIKARLKKDKVKGAAAVNVGTIHSIFFKFYRQIEKNFNPYYSGIPKLMKEGAKFSYLKRVVKDNSFNTYRDIKLLVNSISGLKSKGVDPKNVFEYLKVNKATNPEYNSQHALALVYKMYNAYLRSNNKIDFDDMLLLPYLKIKAKDEVREFVKAKIGYLLCDESHDNDTLQNAVLKMLLKPLYNCCFVFDLKQSIYKFRGAVPNDTAKMIQDIKAHIIDLNINYRSTTNIVEHSNTMMQKAPVLLPAKETVAFKKKNNYPIKVISNIDDLCEAEHIQDLIDKYVYTKGYKYKDITILYRTHAQSRSLEDVFFRCNTPYKVFTNQSFFSRSEIKVILDYFKVIACPEKIGKKEFKNIAFNPSRYISNKVIDNLQDGLRREGLKFGDFIENPWCISDMQYCMSDGLIALCTDIKNLRNTKRTPLESLNYIFNNLGVLKYLSEKRSEYSSGEDDKKLNMSVLINSVKQFNDLESFLKYTESIDSKKEKSKDVVHLRTVHSFKGLENKIIIMVGVCEGLLPHRKALGDGLDPEALEEERRVMYVGMTRAERRLIISTINGKFGSFNVIPSRFITEANLKVPVSIHVKLDQ